MMSNRTDRTGLAGGSLGRKEAPGGKEEPVLLGSTLAGKEVEK